MRVKALAAAGICLALLGAAAAWLALGASRPRPATAWRAAARAARAGIAAAVLGAPEGLADSLEHDAHGYLRLVDALRVGSEEASRLLREAVQGARAPPTPGSTAG